jgi:hypothetical protein
MSLFITRNRTKTLSQFTPEVKIKERLKKIEVSGHSRMPDPILFYDELCKQFESCFYNFNKTLSVDFKYDYLDSRSSKWLYQVFLFLKTLSEKGGIIEINWYYEEDDETILDIGEMLQSLVKMPIYLKKL